MQSVNMFLKPVRVDLLFTTGERQCTFSKHFNIQSFLQSPAYCEISDGARFSNEHKNLVSVAINCARY